jgi:aspartate carbamoyltransferase
LKLDLLSEGVSVSPAARRRLSGETDNRPLTLADYASTSGITIRLGEDVWVNAPIAQHNPNFVAAPRHQLDLLEDRFVLRSDEIETPALPMPVPAYHARQNRWGEPYTAYAHTHADRVRISPVEGCAITCKFCDLPYRFRYRTKNIEGLVDAVRTATTDESLPAYHVLISGGTPRLEDYGYLNEVYEAVAAAFPDLDVDIMMMPNPGLLHVDRLDRAGIKGFAVNLEIYNESAARRIMPAKVRLGLKHYLDFIENAAQRLGPGRVRSLLLVGLEDISDTIKGVTALAGRGCEPVLSPFRPDPATPLRDHQPPSAEFLGEVYQRSLAIVQRYGVKLGPSCIPCMHNTLTFPDGSAEYRTHLPPPPPVERGSASRSSVRASQGPDVKEPDRPRPRHLYSINDLARDEIDHILDRAAKFRASRASWPRLDGVIVGLAFFESSLRTRVGFAAAAARLGATSIDVNALRHSPGMSAPESLADTLRVLSGYCDILVVRHPSDEGFHEALPRSLAPVINAGSGTHHHPTQALIDGFTLRQRFGRIAGLRIGIVGDIANSRAASSLIALLALYPPSEMRLAFPPGCNPPQASLAALSRTPLHSGHILDPVALDILYVAGLPPGRGPQPHSQPLRDAFRVTSSSFSHLAPPPCVMSPLPRIDEIDSAFDASPSACYFDQSDDGLYVRMALLEDVRTRGTVRAAPAQG